MDFRLVENLIAKRFQVRDRVNPDEVVEFIPNPAQRRLLALCQKLHDEKRRIRIISVKSRRVGFSRIVDAIACCYMFAYPNFEGRVMAHFDETAADILSSVALMVYGDGSPGKGIPQRGRSEFWESDREYKSVTIQHRTKAGRGVSRLSRASAKVRGKGRGLGFSFYHGCLSADSEVIMEDGNTLPISEVRSGMKICTHGGTFAKVLRFIPQPEQHPTICIRTWLNGEPLTVTPNHKIFTSRGWVSANDLTLKDEIGTPIPHEKVKIIQLGSDDLFRNTFLDLGHVRHPKKGKGLIRGQIPLDREFGFFVGHYLAEGWIKNQYRPKYGPAMPSIIQLGCNINERPFVDRSLRAINKFCASSKVEEVPAHNKLVVTIYGGSLAQLIDQEFGRKDSKRIPDWIFKTPAEFRIGLMLGYVAGDGSKGIDRTAGYENAAISITSIRKRLLVQYRRMMASVGWGYAGLHAKSAKIDKRGWKCQKAYSLRINGDAADRIRREFVGVIFKTADFSGRSRNRANAATKYRLDEGMVWLKIRSIEEAKIQPVYDIEVDHPDHSFDTSIGAVANSEAGFYPEDSPFTAVLPALAKSPDRSFAALESTGNGVVGDGEAFYKYWQQASDPDKLTDSEWVRFFVPWMEDPYAVSNAVPNDIPRDDEEKTLVKIGLSKRQIAWRRAEIATYYQGIVEDFNVECPTTPEDAFLAGGFPAFAHEERDYVNSTTRPPQLTCELERTREPFVIKLAPMGVRGRIKIWELPQPQMEYYIGADLARGEDMKRPDSQPGDYAAITVFNGTTGEQAASFCDRIDPSKMADLLDKIGRFYRTPEISQSHCAYLNIEMNANLGTECQRQLRDRYAYPAWRFPRWRGSKDDRYNRRAGTAIGWETTTASRNLMFGAFRSSMREKAFAIRDEELARQVCASTMHDGRWEITHGHDDLLVSALLAWITRQQFPPQKIIPRRELPDRPHPLAQFEGSMFPLVEELSRTEDKEMRIIMDPRKRNAMRDPLQGVLTKGLLE